MRILPPLKAEHNDLRIRTGWLANCLANLRYYDPIVTGYAIYLRMRYRRMIVNWMS